jgi:hypothetical protein
MQDDLSSNLPSATGLQGPLILHLSADYPDSFRNRTTLAVRNLVAATPGFEHVVVSLKRRSLPWNTYLRKEPRDPVARVFAFGYWGLPFGIAHLASMWFAARRIRALLAEEVSGPRSFMRTSSASKGSSHGFWRVGLNYRSSHRCVARQKPRSFAGSPPTGR